MLLWFNMPCRSSKYKLFSENFKASCPLVGVVRVLWVGWWSFVWAIHGLGRLVVRSAGSWYFWWAGGAFGGLVVILMGWWCFRWAGGALDKGYAIWLKLLIAWAPATPSPHLPPSQLPHSFSTVLLCLCIGDTMQLSELQDRGIFAGRVEQSLKLPKESHPCYYLNVNATSSVSKDKTKSNIENPYITLHYRYSQSPNPKRQNPNPKPVCGLLFQICHSRFDGCESLWLWECMMFFTLCCSCRWL